MLSPTCRAASSLSPLLRSSFCIILPRFRSPSVLRQFSSATPYPLYYELINYRPDRRIPSRNSNTPSAPAAFKSESSSDPFSPSTGETLDESEPMDRAKRRYYRKRQKRMYGEPASDSDSERRSANEDFVKLRPEIVDFPTLHAREQEIYFYDAFALPWEKDKHYRMVYQLEKKYFPEYSLDKAFVDPATESPRPEQQFDARLKKGKRFLKKNEDEGRDDRALMFFDGEKDNQKVERTDGDASEKKVERKDGRRDASEKKVEDFFKLLKKAPNVRDRRDVAATEECVEPFLSSRRLGLPARWDGPSGTVVLVDKPKGWTSFTVCGKLRRLIKVQKVGHAGTLDPMATGLLVICVGKGTKLVESYQGMVKGYSGIFRIGEATSTWDADSPVIQREAWEHIKDEEIKKVAASFRGEIWQVPPMFSAIKVGGERMYDKARRGEMLELSPRRITIFKFDIERSLEDRQNLIFRVSCSKGTYIRSLCADLGKALGRNYEYLVIPFGLSNVNKIGLMIQLQPNQVHTGDIEKGYGILFSRLAHILENPDTYQSLNCAHLTSLRRDSIGDYTADDAWNFQDLEAQINKSYL